MPPNIVSLEMPLVDMCRLAGYCIVALPGFCVLRNEENKTTLGCSDRLGDNVLRSIS